MVNNLENTILCASEEILKEKGIKFFNIRNIAKRSKIAIGTIYLYYPSKSDIVIALLDKLLHDLKLYCEQNVNDKGDLLQSLETIYLNYANFLDEFQVNLMSELTMLIVNSNKNIKNTHVNYFTEMIEKLLIKYKDSLDQELFNNLNFDEIINIIIMVFNDNLRKNNKDFSKIKIIIKKLLY